MSYDLPTWLTRGIHTYGTALSILLTVAGTLVAVYAVLRRRLITRHQRIYNEFGFGDLVPIARQEHHSRLREKAGTWDSPPVIARSHVRQRMLDAERAKGERESAANVSKWAANLLTFGQYVVGGLLASSFAQQSLSKNEVGYFGLLVLFASIVKQHYRPDVNAEENKQKALRLQALLRHSEDQLAFLDAMHTEVGDQTDALLALANDLSRGLTDIESFGSRDPKPRQHSAATP